MLALLEKVPGVEEGRVDWSGKRFLLRLAPRADVARAVDAAEGVLPDARRADARAELDAVGAFRRGEPWMRSGETLALSREEARVLARRHAAEAARETGLDAAQTQELVAVLEEEIGAAFERIHAAGAGLPASSEWWYAAAQRALERSRAFLRPEQVDRLRESLESALR